MKLRQNQFFLQEDTSEIHPATGRQTGHSGWPRSKPGIPGSRESGGWLTDSGEASVLGGPSGMQEPWLGGGGKQQLAPAQRVTPLQPAAAEKWRTRRPEAWVEAGLL